MERVDQAENRGNQQQSKIDKQQEKITALQSALSKETKKRIESAHEITSLHAQCKKQCQTIDQLTREVAKLNKSINRVTRQRTFAGSAQITGTPPPAESLYRGSTLQLTIQTDNMSYQPAPLENHQQTADQAPLLIADLNSNSTPLSPEPLSPEPQSQSPLSPEPQSQPPQSPIGTPQSPQSLQSLQSPQPPQPPSTHMYNTLFQQSPTNVGANAVDSNSSFFTSTIDFNSTASSRN